MYQLIFFLGIVLGFSVIIYRSFSLPKNASAQKTDRVFMLVNYCLALPVLFFLHQTVFFMIFPVSLYYLNSYVFMLMYIALLAVLDGMFSTSSMHYAKYLQASLIAISFCAFLFPAVPTFYLIVSCASVVSLQEFFDIFMQDDTLSYKKVCINRFMAVPMTLVLGLLFEQLLIVRVCAFLGLAGLNLCGLRYNVSLFDKGEKMLSFQWLPFLQPASEKEQAQEDLRTEVLDLEDQGNGYDYDKEMVELRI